jgi:malonate transporter and related proteins
VGLVALAINLTVPIAMVLLEIDAAGKHRETTKNSHKPNPVLTGLNAGLHSPLLWAPLLGIGAVLAV